MEDTYHFLISYCREDESWAHWIAWQIEDALLVGGEPARVFFDVWDVVPGDSTAGAIDRGLRQSAQVVVVLSPRLLSSAQVAGDLWQSAWSDSSGDGRPQVVPVRVVAFDPGGLLRGRRYVDLAGLDETAATAALRSGLGHAVRGGRAKSPDAPHFPGPVGRPSFPGAEPAPELSPLTDSSETVPEASAPLDRPGGAFAEGGNGSAGVATAPRQAGRTDGQRGKPATGRRRARVWRLVAVALTTVVVIAVASTAAILRPDRHAVSASVPNVALEATGTAGGNPFMPAVGNDTAEVKPPADIHGVLPADTPGLYGGTRDSARCDPPKMTAFLKAHPSLLAAWSSVLGIKPSGLDNYVAGLTPAVLRTDTAVTNHGYQNGHPTAIPAVLQAGTAVLVDGHGVPVVKCFCGNPLTPPARYSTVRYTGPHWTGFSERTVTSIKPVTTTISVFILVDIRTGKPFQRPVGSGGNQDKNFVKTTPGCGGAGRSPLGGGLELVVTSGQISCADARKVLDEYRAAPATDKQGSGGYVTLGAWNCGHDTFAGVQQSGDDESCQNGNISIGTRFATTASALSPNPISVQWPGSRLSEGALLDAEFYYPGGSTDNPLVDDTGSMIRAPSSKVFDLTKVDCNNFATSYIGHPQDYLGENSYASVRFSGGASDFAENIVQFATAAAASDYLAALQAVVQRCSASTSGIFSGISLQVVDGYPALAFSTPTARTIYVANGVDIVNISAIGSSTATQLPSTPTLPAAADAVMAGIVALSS